MTNIPTLSKDEFLVLYYKNYNDLEISKVLNVSHDRIGRLRNKLKLRCNKQNNLIKKLTYEEEQILLGTVLGDANLNRPIKSMTSGTTGSLEQGISQKLYLEWKYSKLQRFLSPIVYKERLHNVRKVMEKRCYCKFRTFECLNLYYTMFYDENNKKYLSEKTLSLLDSLGLAVWFMDDGSKTNSGGYYLHTNSFSKENQEFAIKILENRFKLKINLHKTTKGSFIMYISARSAKQFERLVSPYIIDSMKYKLHNKVYKYNMIEIQNSIFFTNFRGLKTDI
jgi:hypothetical protein